MAETAAGATRSVDDWLAQAQALEAAGQLDEAEGILGQVLQARPDHPAALQQAGILSYRRKRPLEALERLERVIALAPGQALHHRNICEIYRSQSRLEEALAHGMRALELAPHDAGVRYNLCVIHYDRLEIDKAIGFARTAVALEPGMAAAHFELAEGLLISGQFEEGWREYEWRFDLPGAPPLLPPHNRPLWDGKPMPSGTLMLIADQGFGDTIQFSRYISAVAKLCPNLIMAGSPEMRPIVTQQSGITAYFDRWEQMPVFDAYCSLSGLPRLFGANLQTIPAPKSYVTAAPEKIAHWGARLDALVPSGYRRIGLVWAGRPTHGNDFNRSMTLRQLGALAKLPKTALISVQMGAAQAEIGQYFGAAPLINLGAEIADFSDTMGIVEQLDQLVAVDTGVAHLAAAMGKQTAILLPFAPDWRWLLGRSDSPWYPSVTLFRQDAPGDWESAIAKLMSTFSRG